METQLKRSPKSSAERFKVFYRKLKTDSEKYSKYLQQKKQASKQYYINAKKNDNEEERKRKREANRLNVQRCREKKKLSSIQLAIKQEAADYIQPHE